MALHGLIQDLQEWESTAFESFHDLNESYLPEINTSFRHLRDITNEALAALLKANDPPVLFVRSGKITRIRSGKKGLPVIELVNQDALRGILARCANFIKKTRTGTAPDDPPIDVVKDMMALGDWNLPQLRGVIEAPTIRNDGSILMKTGYDPETELLLIPNPGMNFPGVNDNPNNEGVRLARDLLLETICDFPFENEASRANMIAAIITPIIRPIIKGYIPMVIFNAPQPGTGKTLLADITSIITNGRTATTSTPPVKEEEWQKFILSILLEGQYLVILDNIKYTLSSAALASVLTSLSVLSHFKWVTLL